MICQIMFRGLVFSVTLSVWIYLLKWCHQKNCGIIHHINRNNSYDSILMQLTGTGGSQQLVGYTWYQFRGFDWGIMRWLWVMMCVYMTVEQTVLCINKERWISCGEIYECHISCVGDIIIQARVKTGEDEAFQATVVLPLRKWIRLDCYIQDSKVKNHSVCHWEVGWGIEINIQLGATSLSPPFSSEFPLVPLLCSVWFPFWNSCRILKDGSFPAGKLQAIAVYCNLESFTAEWGFFLCRDLTHHYVWLSGAAGYNVGWWNQQICIWVCLMSVFLF